MIESDFELPADLLIGCIELGGLLRCQPDRIAFVPSDGEELQLPFAEIVEMRLGGRHGADANRMDLRLLDGQKVTLLVVGRDRLADLILAHRGWDRGIEELRDDRAEEEHASPPSNV